MVARFVIVGGGLAAAHAAAGLREAGYDGEVVLHTAEPHLPYERPPLSKGYLMGNDDLASVFVHPQEWYADHHVELRVGEPVTSIDPVEHLVTSTDRTEGYDRLLLATGAQPRALPFDTGSAPVATLRTIEDSQRLQQAFGDGRRIVLVGGGWIGLEVAAAAREAGSEVTVLEALALPLVGALGPEVATVFADLHRKHGVDVRTGVTVAGIEAADGAGVVRLESGEGLPADLVVVGIGAAPDTALAEAAGLATDNGILVDATLTTSDADVFAAGDVANAAHPALGGRIRVEHWDTAIGQGGTAGHNMAGGSETYDRLPYFFTDQYDLGMEYVGSTAGGYDEVVLRGDTDALDFSAWWLSAGRVAAALHVNQWDAIDDVRRLVGQVVDAAALHDPRTPLSDIGDPAAE